MSLTLSPHESNDRYKQTHCRSCLSKVPSGYPPGAHYTPTASAASTSASAAAAAAAAARSPSNRCEACLHTANLYDLSEDHPLQDSLLNPSMPQEIGRAHG